MSALNSARLETVEIGLPFGIGKTVWKSDETQSRAAWELYVELATRVSVERLDLSEGSVREALNSLHSLYGSTRQILRAHGPGVGAGPDTVGGIAIRVLNKGLRPFLSKWHPLLSDWEATRDSTVGTVAHERKWSEEAKLRGELEKLREQLASYATALGKMAGVLDEHK